MDDNVDRAAGELVFRDSHNRQGYYYVNRPVTIAEPHGQPINIPCIVLVDASTGLIVDIPRMERWYLGLINSEGMTSATLNKKAYAICALLNYLQSNTGIRALNELTVSILRQFYISYKQCNNGSNRSADGWERDINTVANCLNSYYEHNIAACEWGYHPEEIITKICAKDDKGRLYIQQTAKKLGVKTPRVTHRKNRYLVYGYLDLYLFCCQKYDPMLTGGVAFQAFAGLREGELVNLTWGRIHQISSGFGRIGRIELDLEEKAAHALNYRGKTEFGAIKIPRKQEVYTDFVHRMQDYLRIHEEILKGKGLPCEKDDPLFYNTWGQPMSVETYKRRVKAVFYDYFVPTLKLMSERGGTWAENAPYIEAYTKEYPGAHMFRHWYTMYLLEKARIPKEEISHWRGDAHSDTLEDYIHVNAEMIKHFRNSAYMFQKSILEAIK